MRRADWLERLWATLKAAEEREFYYGACVRLSAECVDAMTDGNFVEQVAPLIEASREHPIELETLAAFVTQYLGDSVPMNCAGRGDVVLLDLPVAGPTLGICSGDRIACAQDPVGVCYVKRVRGLCAWAVD